MKSDFFKTDSSEKYYILGLLYSDGYLTENNNKEYVGLKLIDKQILDDISSLTECNQPYKCGVTSANNQLYRIEFRDKQVIEDLKNLGFHKRKTFTITYPNIPFEYNGDFIRGVFDGDGCIHFSKKKGRINSYVTNFQILGTFDLLEGIKKYIGVDVRIIPYRKIAKLLVDKKNDLNKIYNFLYKNENCLCLERKRSHFNECLSVIKESYEAQKAYVKKEQEPRMTTEEFIEKAKIVHGGKYDYIKTKFKNNKTKIKIICPTHGEFEQLPYHHLRGSGCRECAFEKIHKSNKRELNEFIAKAKELYGDKYDYSKVEYVNAHAKICVICPIHGEFWVTPSNHLQNRGCRKCGLEKRSAERRKKKKNEKDKVD